MTEGIRDWLVGLIAAAMLTAIAAGITPKGTVGTVGKLVGGLVFLLCLLRPVAGVDLEQFSQNLTRGRVESGTYGAALEETNAQLQKTIIEERAAAYSEEQALQLGIVCHISILCNVGEDGVPYPREALVEGTLTREEQAAVQRMLEADLAISPESVFWKTEAP